MKSLEVAVEAVVAVLAVLRDRRPKRVEVVLEREEVVDTTARVGRCFEDHDGCRTAVVERRVVVAMTAEDPWRRSNLRRIRGRRDCMKRDRTGHALKCMSNDVHVG